jgi:hypothetical protein
VPRSLSVDDPRAGQEPTISALRGAMVTSTSTKPAADSMARTSSSGAAPAMQPAMAAAWFCRHPAGRR